MKAPLISLEDNLDYLVENFLFYLLHPCPSAMPEGHIKNKACEKTAGRALGERGADCQTGRAVPQPESCSVSVGALTVSADLSFPRGLCERGQKCDAAPQTQVTVESVSSGHVGSPSLQTPLSFSPFFS